MRIYFLKQQKGFTLIELLVVIAIIGILSSVVLASLNSARAKARDAKRMSDLKSIETALNLYYSDYGSYPSTGSIDNVYMDLGCDGTAVSPDAKTADWIPGLSPLYMSKLPQDPSPNNSVGVAPKGCYMYASNGTNYVLSSWASVEGKTSFGTGLYRKVGFRETNFSNSQSCIVNYAFFNTPTSWYGRSYTISSYDDGYINSKNIISCD